MEPVEGFEPPTYRLQGGRSTIKSYTGLSLLEVDHPVGAVRSNVVCLPDDLKLIVHTIQSDCQEVSQGVDGEFNHIIKNFPIGGHKSNMHPTLQCAYLVPQQPV